MAVSFEKVDITFEAAGAVPALSAVGEYAVFHLTRGAKLVAGGDGKVDVNKFDPAYKITGTFDVVATGGEDVSALEFGFIQVANGMVSSALWGGRLKEHGFTKRDLLASYSKNPSLDSKTAFKPWTHDNPSSARPLGKIGGAERTRVTCKVGEKGGDHPSGFLKLKRPNGFNKADNFLFEQRHDLGLISVLCAIDKGKVTQLAYVTCHIVWHFKIFWQGVDNPKMTIKQIASRFDRGRMVLGPFDDARFVNQAAIKAIVDKPEGPMYNDIATAAIVNQLIGTGAGVSASPVRNEEFPDNFYT